MSGWIVVDSVVREAIESLEPATHQFFPIRVYHKDGSEEDRGFSIFHTPRCIHATRAVEMGGTERVAPDGFKAMSLPNAFPDDLILLLDREKIGSAHVWVDDGAIELRGKLFLSQQMLKAIKTAGGKPAYLYPCVL